MPGRLVLKLMDYDRDTIQLSLESDVSSAAGYDADLAAAEALADAIEAITLGTRVYRDFIANRDEVSPAVAAANPFAQVNIQWLATYEINATSEIRTVRIGTADLSITSGIINGVPYLDLTAGAGLALKTAFEAFVTEGGQAVTLNSVTYKE